MLISYVMDSISARFGFLRPASSLCVGIDPTEVTTEHSSDDENSFKEIPTSKFLVKQGGSSRALPALSLGMILYARQNRGVMPSHLSHLAHNAFCFVVFSHVMYHSSP